MPEIYLYQKIIFDIMVSYLVIPKCHYLENDFEISKKKKKNSVGYGIDMEWIWNG
jgi:hypothetical protein